MTGALSPSLDGVVADVESLAFVFAPDDETAGAVVVEFDVVAGLGSEAEEAGVGELGIAGDVVVGDVVAEG